MVLVHIITEQKAQALEIIDLLLERKLLFNAMLSRKKVYEKCEDTRELCGKVQTLIIGKTKALLFNRINKLLTSKYPKKMPSLYCLPIVYIDPERGEKLLKETEKI